MPVVLIAAGRWVHGRSDQLQRPGSANMSCNAEAARAAPANGGPVQLCNTAAGAWKPTTAIHDRRARGQHSTAQASHDACPHAQAAQRPCLHLHFHLTQPKYRSQTQAPMRHSCRPPSPAHGSLLCQRRSSPGPGSLCCRRSSIHHAKIHPSSPAAFFSPSDPRRYATAWHIQPSSSTAQQHR